MKTINSCLIVCLLTSLGCSRQESMSRAERQQYYADYNNSRTQAEWDSISWATQLANQTRANQKTDRQINADTLASIPFRIRNTSLFPKTVEIAGNALRFNPFELRYVGFPAGTSVYHYDENAPDKRGKFLFTVESTDANKLFKL